MITAGFGRVADFEFFHTAEIRNMLTVNTVSTIQIIRIFYDRIKSDKTFYCGVMGSISGLISSPMTSVYAASKAAVFRFIESVNIELEATGFKNRILNVSPGSFKGSRFYGGQNDPDQLVDLARSVLRHLYNSETLYIPKYEEIFKSVIERYHSDPHEYGLYSYNFKKSSERAANEKKVVIGYIRGDFHELDIDTVKKFKYSRGMCDHLIVGLYRGENAAALGSDEIQDRIEVIVSCRYVDDVIAVTDDRDAIKQVDPDVFFVSEGSQTDPRLDEFLSGENIRKVKIDTCSAMPF
jgi:glycerol-3-phosphate cytidylyltransferase-like family protein